jgi:hypothetical protein
MIRERIFRGASGQTMRCLPLSHSRADSLLTDSSCAFFRSGLRLAIFLVVAAGILTLPFHLIRGAESTNAPGISGTSNSSAAPPAIDGKKFHALLVGCTKYDNLNESKWLNGPANDVDLVRRYFVEDLKLPKESIVVLSEPEAAAHGETFRPTRANIEREIQKLIDTAQAGDQVVIGLGGHGGQQPEHPNADPTYLKPDGLDQMFLPCDCGHWSSKKHCVDGAIVDYEMRDWCKQITHKKARLWVILDSCCSGWTMRDAGPERPRRLVADDLGIPKADIDRANNIGAARQPAGRGEGTRGSGSEAPTFDIGPPSPDYVGLYAAQRDECEMEMPMPCTPDANQSQRVQGLLSYAIVDILSRASRPITYGELANLVHDRYAQWGRTIGPTPLIEGLAEARDRIVLGMTRVPDRSRRLWKKGDGGTLKLNEGSIEGLAPGSIVALYPPADQSNAETVIGYAKVKSCELLESDVKAVKYNGMESPRTDSLFDTGCFKVAWTDFGSMRLKLAVDPEPMRTIAQLANAAASRGTADSPPTETADVAASAAMLRTLSSQLKTESSQDGLIWEAVDDPRSAQWVVQLRDGKLVLLSRDASQVRNNLPPETPQFKVPMTDTAAEVDREITRIARAQNLVELSKMEQAGADQTASGGAAADDSTRPNVEFKILRYKSRTDRNGAAVDFSKGPLTLVPGDFVGWRMTNHSPFDVAVSLLYIDAGFGVHSLYPRAGSGTDNLLTRNGGTYATRPIKVTASPVGNEHVVLFAVPRRVGSQPPDFSFLEQPTLPKTRGARDENPALNSAIGRVLQQALYGAGGTRGLDSDDAAETHLMLQSWRVSTDADQ